MGRGYVIEHCVSASKAMQKEDEYHEYVTEILRCIAKANGVSISISYRDILESYKDAGEERKPEDVINSIKKKADIIRG